MHSFPLNPKTCESIGRWERISSACRAYTGRTERCSACGSRVPYFATLHDPHGGGPTAPIYLFSGILAVYRRLVRRSSMLSARTKQLWTLCFVARNSMEPLEAAHAFLLRNQGRGRLVLSGATSTWTSAAASASDKAPLGRASTTIWSTTSSPQTRKSPVFSSFEESAITVNLRA